MNLPDLYPMQVTLSNKLFETMLDAVEAEYERTVRQNRGTVRNSPGRLRYEVNLCHILAVLREHRPCSTAGSWNRATG